MNDHPGLFVAFLLSAAVILLILPAPRASAPPPANAYVSCTVDLPVAETSQRFIVSVDSMTWQYDNVTGNFSLLPSWSAVNITLRDPSHYDVVIDRDSATLFNGSAEFIYYVDPVWTSTRVNITVEDPQHGLVGWCGVKTTYSMDYLVWLFENKWIGIFLEYKNQVDAKAQADLDARTALMLVTFTALGVALFLGFMKYDHKRMRGVGLPSLWDRFANRVWPFSLLVDAEYIRLGEDQLESWDRESVERYRKSKRERSIAALEKQKDRIDSDIERIKLEES